MKKGREYMYLTPVYPNPIPLCMSSTTARQGVVNCCTKVYLITFILSKKGRYILSSPYVVMGGCVCGW